MAINKIPISFKQSEIDIYNFIKNKRNASCYIKDLVEKDMCINKESVIENQVIKKDEFKNDFGFDF